MREAHKGLPLTQVTPTSFPVAKPTADAAAASHAAGSQLTIGTDSSWGVPDVLEENLRTFPKWLTAAWDD